MEAFIKAISYYLPEQVVSNDDLVMEFPEWTVEKIADKIGVRNRHIAAADETASDMAAKAAEKLFAEYGIDRSNIDFLILCTQSPDFFLPSSACILQDRLGLSTDCGAFDIDLGCSGYEYGLAVAKGLLLSGVASNVLLLTAETYSKHIHPRDKGNRTIFGDAAAATLISLEGFAKIGDFVLGTDGSGYESLIHKSGAWRQNQALHDLTFDESGNPHTGDAVFMDGRAIFDFTADVVPSMVERTLQKNKCTPEDIDLYVFHQANKYMINYLRKLMGISKEKFFVFLQDVGNTVSSTIPIALYEAKKEGRLHGNIVLAGFGVGLSYGATVLNAR